MRLFLLKMIIIVAMVPVMSPLRAIAKERFNLNALDIDNPAQFSHDIESINQGLEQVPGQYRVSVFVNGQYRFTRDILFSPGDDNKLYPVLDNQDLTDCGVSKHFLAEKKNTSVSESAGALLAFIPQARFHADLDNLRLDLEIPQAYTNTDETGAAGRHADSGMIAAFTRYDVSGAQTYYTQGMKNTVDDYFIRLQNGINYNDWHLRNNINLSPDYSKPNMKDNYLERDIPSILSRLTVGQSFTSSDIFDSMNIRGIQLSSQDEMLNDTEEGFSPVIRGLAPTPAKVEIYKNGYSIYQTFVAAGPFELKNLPSEAGNGDLEVRLTESSGKVSHFNYNSSSVPIMQRKGKGKYTFAMGKILDSAGAGHDFMQYTHAHGFSNKLTLFGGGMYSLGYRSLLAGLGLNLGSAGALSLDITSAMIGGRYATGGLRSRYYKIFNATDTTITLSNSFFPDKNYTRFDEISVLGGLRDRGKEKNDGMRTVSQSQLSISQSTGAGSLFISFNDMRYRNRKNDSRSVNAGYNFSVMRCNLSVTLASVRHYLTRYNEKQISLMLQIPFNVLSGSVTTGTSLMSSAQGTTVGTTLTGSAMEKNQLTYNLQKSHVINVPDSDLMSLNTALYSSNTLSRLGYNQSKNQKQINYGLQGGVVMHSGGLTFSQPTGETFGIISTSGIEGIELLNSKGIRSDRNGYMIVPNLTPYRKNTLHLNVPSGNDFAEVNEPIQTVMPAHGAIAFSEFSVKSGTKALLSLHFKSGFVPFGATVTTEDKSSGTGIVGTEGSVYLTGLKDEGRLTAQWGRSDSQSCHANFNLRQAAEHKKVKIIRRELQCA